MNIKSALIAMLASLLLGLSIGVSVSTVRVAPLETTGPMTISIPAPNIVKVAAHIGTTPFGWNGVISATGKPLVGVVSPAQRFAILKQELDEARLPDDRLALMREIAALPPVYAPQEYTTHAATAGTYHVVRGDSLSAIAAKEGISMDAIFTANPAAFIASNPNVLMAGVDLTIPRG